MELFNKNINECNSTYKKVRDGEHPMEVSGRNLCNSLWSVFEAFSDDHFVNQFSIDFYARFWEMDLTCAFIEKGFCVSCPKPGPDISINVEGKTIWIEAIAPGNGSGDDKVPEIITGITRQTPEDQIILRLTSAISKKHKKYKKYLENGLVAPDEPYIIAINGSQVWSSKAEDDPPRIVRTVFPIGQQYVDFGQETGSGFEFRPKVYNAKGADIFTDIFLDPGFEGVSAVLFSNSDCCNRPEHTGDEFILVHNPMAKNKLKEGLLKWGREYIAEIIDESNCRLRWNNYKNA